MVVARDLNVKPQLGSTGRNRAVGTLEAHQNGFRWVCRGRQYYF